MRSGRGSYVPWQRAASVVVAAVIAVAGVGCSASNPSPRVADPGYDIALERYAAERCHRQRPAHDLPPHPFTTDVCSLWPDGDWGYCCVEHDIAYWCGGPDEAREQADTEFRACVALHGDGLASVSYLGVRVGGPGWMPFPWRWGYGWDWLEDPP
jgi:hypothetical protein